MSRWIRGVILLGFMAAMVGCVSVDRQAGFGDVQSGVEQRTGQRVHWNNGTAEDSAVAGRIEAMLARELTIDSAAQVALLNNRNLQAAYEEMGISQAELVQAGLLSNPVMEFAPLWPTKSGYRITYQATVTQDFLDIFAMPLRKKVAAEQLAAAKARVTSEVVAMVARARGAFVRYEAAVQLVELRRQVAQAAEASYELARRLREAGNITRLALINEQAMNEKAKLDLADAEAEEADAREELSVLMGLTGDMSHWKTAGRLPELGDGGLNILDLEKTALRQRADLEAAAADVRSLASSLELSDFSRFPFSVGAKAESEVDRGGPTKVGPLIQAGIPIFDQGQARVAMADARMRQAMERYAAMAVEVQGEVRRAANRMAAQQRKAEHVRKVIIPLKQSALKETQLAYNAMQAGAFTLLAAKQGEIDAGSDYIAALRDYWLARVELEKAVGGGLNLVDARAATRPADTRPADTNPTTQPAHHVH